MPGRELHFTPKKVVQILNAYCALHNSCLTYNVEVPTVIQINEDRSYLTLPNIEQNEFSRLAQTVRDRSKITLRS